MNTYSSAIRVLAEALEDIQTTKYGDHSLYIDKILEDSAHQVSEAIEVLRDMGGIKDIDKVKRFRERADLIEEIHRKRG